MTLQDDIARYAEGATPFRCTSDGPTVAAIAAGLEREYHLVKRGDLPKLRDDGAGQAQLLGYVALVLHLQSRGSEAAVLEARRDELARELANPHTHYVNLTLTSQAAIDRIITAEAEVARLKAAS